MPYSDRLSISTAPRDGTLIRFWCRSEAEPLVGRTGRPWQTRRYDVAHRFVGQP
jgi:hypothetical protein